MCHYLSVCLTHSPLRCPFIPYVDEDMSLETRYKKSDSCSIFQITFQSHKSDRLAILAKNNLSS